MKLEVKVAGAGGGNKQGSNLSIGGKRGGNSWKQFDK